MFKFKNTYQSLPTTFYDYVKPYKFNDPQILLLNESLAEDLNLDINKLKSQGHLYLSSNQIVNQPIAQAYAGHQFGHFTMLGDGRALLLGELETSKGLIDLQLKGSGPTKYSRRGDGKATLVSMLREYIISEAMHHLHIPTTRSLAVLTTGENVRREETHDGAILVRSSKAHIRVGTFQYAAVKKEVKELADYTIKRLYPYVNDYTAFLEEVVKNQAGLIAKWQSIGFIHGVMNTDNMSIAGETIDYGPCAFMDTYKEDTVFSSIDDSGRYAYKEQPSIGLWNLTRFAETLIPLLSDSEDESIKTAQQILGKFNDYYFNSYLTHFAHKIGISDPVKDDLLLINKLLQIMQDEKLDFTHTFRNLATLDLECLKEWKTVWSKRLELSSIEFDAAVTLMNAHNPSVIPRNHLVEKVLEDSKSNNYDGLYDLLTVIKTPFKEHTSKYTTPPPDDGRVYRTYCGT